MHVMQQSLYGSRSTEAAQRLRDNRVFTVVDVETTGLNPGLDRVCEFGAVRYVSGHPVAELQSLVNPGVHIPCTVSAINGIMDEDVQGQPFLEDLAEQIRQFAQGSVLVAHHADFDRAFLPFLDDFEWLCSMRLARHIWLDAPSYGLRALRFWLGYRHIAADRFAPHRALGDALTAGVIAEYAIEHYIRDNPTATMQDLLAYVDQPLSNDVLTQHGARCGDRIGSLPLRYLISILEDHRSAPDERKPLLDVATLRTVRRAVRAKIRPLLRQPRDVLECAA